MTVILVDSTHHHGPFPSALTANVVRSMLIVLLSSTCIIWRNESSFLLPPYSLLYNSKPKPTLKQHFLNVDSRTKQIERQLFKVNLEISTQRREIMNANVQMAFVINKLDSIMSKIHKLPFYILKCSIILADYNSN